MMYVCVSLLLADINWGSSTQAFLYAFSIRNLLKLEKLGDHVKNFRPHFLVLSGPPSSRPDLVSFASQMSKDAGVMICGQVLLVRAIDQTRLYMYLCTYVLYVVWCCRFHVINVCVCVCTCALADPQHCYPLAS